MAPSRSRPLPTPPAPLSPPAAALAERGDQACDRQEWAQALAHYEAALALQPTAALHQQRGAMLYQLGRYAGAAAAFADATEWEPTLAPAWRNLAMALRMIGAVDGSLAASRRALELAPDHEIGRMAHAYTLHYDPETDGAALLAAAEALALRHATPLTPSDPRFANAPDPDRRLRVAFLSGDFCEHPVASYLLPLWRALDRGRIEIVAASSGRRSDTTTAQLRTLADRWLDLAGLDDAAASAALRDARIDIAIDLSGYTLGTRLGALARRPAPIQVSWLGYPGTTGIKAIDSRLTDAVADPPGAADLHHSEHLVRLPGGFLVWAPPPDCPAVVPLPSQTAGHVTFGAFTAILAKTNPPLIACWARILAAVPDSRLMLKALAFRDPLVRTRFTAAFATHGIPADRLVLLDWMPSRHDHLALHNQVDIALDSFPYNGTTTSCEALWMGVPVVTLAGDRHAARVGASLLTHLGLPELIATDTDGYVATAVALARDPRRLSELRSELREKMATSSLCDAEGFARNFEAALRDLWRQWCQSAAAEPRRIDWTGLGIELYAAGRPADAATALAQALTLDAGDRQAADHHGAALLRLGRTDQALALFQAEADRRPEDPDAWHNLGTATIAADHFLTARAIFADATRRFPDRAAAWSDLSAIDQLLGDGVQAIAANRRALALEPGRLAAASGLVLQYLYRPETRPQQALAEARAFARHHADPLSPPDPDFPNPPQPSRRLRVAYLSADLRQHPVASFLAPLLTHHDRGQVEIFLYASNAERDAASDRLRALADQWRDVAGLDDSTVADSLRADSIDLAIDLSGHTGGHRLLALARRPAPVQISWLGFPGSVGMSAIGWRLTDAIADPPGAEFDHSETLLRLPQGFLCWEPPASCPAVGPLPAATAGHVTFGAFTAMLAKLNPPLLALWGHILTALPTARLVLKSRFFRDPAVVEQWQARFATLGVSADRLDLLSWLPDPAAHLERHNHIDIALDSHPYNGTTTTCEALWMGVPVITLAGDRHASRVGASLLHRVGLDALVAHTPDEYVATAVRLARDPTWLADLRRGLRGRMAASPLRDGPGFARNVEAAFRTAWTRWCSEQTAAGAADDAAALEAAAARHRAGDHAAAEAGYRALLSRHPDHPDALHLLGVLALQQGHAADAVGLIERALSLAPHLPNGRTHLGAAYRAAGRPGDAVQLQRQVLAQRPDDADAHYNLGLAQAAAGDATEAAQSLAAALRLRPDHRAAALERARLLAQAPATEAIAALRQAAALAPEEAGIWMHLGIRLLQADQAAAAETALARACALAPADRASADWYGAALMALGRAGDAVHWYGRLADLHPDDPDLRHNLGSAQLAAGRLEAAIDNLGAAIAAAPHHVRALGNLAVAYKEAGRPTAALDAFRRALALDPSDAARWNNYGVTLREAGEPVEADAAFARALTLAPGYGIAADNRLFALNYRADLTAPAVIEAHRAWGGERGASAPPASDGHGPDPARPLRVGLLSPDFNGHPVACFLEPLLATCRQGGAFSDQIEFIAYAELRHRDATTARLHALVPEWHETVGMDDTTLADRIRADRIDLLVDLAGHTAGNRLAAVALAPAPAIATWLGYPNITGLPAIGWRLTDAIADPPGDADTAVSERPLRLPSGFLCYRPPLDTPLPEAGPATEGGPVTFGSFNNFSKLSPPTLALWADILRAVPQARLLLKSRPLGDPTLAAAMRQRFAAMGIDPARLELAGWLAERGSHLGAYRRIDIALDPFPYNGTTTTCEALWMGVPVIALAGDRHAARVGASLLTQTGLTRWLAADPADYVRLAVSLAADRDGRRHWRQALRPHLAASALCDEVGFATGFIAACRRMVGGSAQVPASQAPSIPG